MIFCIVEHLALLPFTLGKESGDELALVIGEATDGLTTPQEMLGLDVSAILFCDGDQMVEAIVAQGGVPPRMAMVGNGDEMVEAIPGVMALAIIGEIAVLVVVGMQALGSWQATAALDEHSDGIGLVGMHDGGAIWCGHAGEVIRPVIVEIEVLPQATMGLDKTVGGIVEETPVGGVFVPALLIDAIDGVRGALVVIAPGLPGMVGGSEAAGMAVVRNKTRPL